MGCVAFDKVEARRGMLISGTPAGYAPDSSKFLQAADIDGNVRWVDLNAGNGMYQGAGTRSGSNYWELGVQYPVWQVKAASTPGAPALASASGILIAIYGTVVDGVSVGVGDLILLKDFTDAPERNGVWVVTALNTPFAGATQLARVNGVESAYNLARISVAVRSGATWAGSMWVADVDSGGVINNTPVNFVTAKAATGTGSSSATPVSQFRSTLAVNQALATPGANIMWPVEEVDTDNWHSTTVNPDRITVDRPGRYLVTCSVSWGTGTAGVRNPTLLKNNTVNLASEADPAPGSVDNVRQNLATVVDLVAGDFLTVQGYHAAGAALNVIAGYTTISVTRLPDYVPTVPTAVGSFSAYKGAVGNNQTLTANTAAKLTFPNEDFDASGWFDTTTSRFTPQQAGVYRISGQMYVFPVLAGTGSVRVYKNGAYHKILGAEASVTGQDYYMPGGSVLVYLNGTTDYVELYGVVSFANGVAQDSGNAACFFQGEYVGLATPPAVRRGFRQSQKTGASYTKTDGVTAAIDTTNLTKTISVASPEDYVEVSLSGDISANAATTAGFDLYVDNVFASRRYYRITGASINHSFALTWSADGLSAGNHVFELRWFNAAGGGSTITLTRTATLPLDFTIVPQ